MSSKIDPVCGMQGRIKKHNHYFCSEECIKKYEKRSKWYKEKLFIVFACLTIIIVFAYFIPFLNPLFHAFLEYAKLIWWAVLLGLLLGGIIDYFVPKHIVYKHLGEKKKKTIFLSVFFGFLMAACSHGILAVAIGLYKKGASASAVVAFLLASPWANLPITILLFSFFGIKALLLIGFAIVIAITTGFVYQFLESKNIIEKNKNAIKTKEKEEKRKLIFAESIKGILNGSWNLARMILWWILIGMFLAALTRAFVPEHFFHTYMSASFLGLLMTLAFATIIEVCSEGSSPIAFEIFKQTGAFGNVFVFLLAGVATDYTEIGLIWQNIGKKAALLLPLITIPQVLIIGYLLNILI